MATIAVVIPLYNKAPHIVKAVESVIAQTSKPDEIIVVDDGSRDGGADLLVPYVEQHGIQLVRQKNRGVSAARNQGVEVASSEYVAFLDADDWWLPGHIETLRRLISAYPEASLLSTAHIIQRGGGRYRPKSSYQDGWEGVIDDFFMRYATNLALVNSITACVKRSNFWRAGAFPIGIRRGEDIICWINIALKFPVAHAEVVTAVYHQDAVNRTDLLIEVEPPGSLQHIAKLLREEWLSEQQRAGLSQLFTRIAFFTAAGFRANGDLEGLSAIRRLAWEEGHYGLASMLTALRWAPTSLLQVAKKIRHPQVKHPNGIGD